MSPRCGRAHISWEHFLLTQGEGVRAGSSRVGPDDVSPSPAPARRQEAKPTAVTSSSPHTEDGGCRAKAPTPMCRRAGCGGPAEGL